MRPVVVDASITAALILPDEWTEKVPQVSRELTEAELYAPMHWSLEIGSIMVTAERRGRITSEERRSYLEKAEGFQGLLDMVSGGPSVVITDLAMAMGLSVYDAAYLELAIRLGARLATNDKRLVNAATANALETLSTL